MKYEFFIAWRYFIGKKSAQAINIISWVSLIAIALATAAMICLFSVFNGIESLLETQNKGFYPDLKINPIQGKFVTISDAQRDALVKLEDIKDVAYSLEDMVLLMGEEEQKIAQLKAVSNNWFDINNISPFITEGNTDFTKNYKIPPVVIGNRIANLLGVSTDNIFSTITIFHPKVSEHVITNPLNAYNDLAVQPIGVFNIEPTLNDKYIIMPYAYAIDLFQLPKGSFSSLEIKLHKGTPNSKLINALKNILGSNFEILDIYQQNKTMYMIVKSEKLATYVILLFVLFIASFNMIGSLIMLVFEKRKDISIIKAIGMNNTSIQRIFLYVGVIITAVGCSLGLILGYLLSAGQKKFGWINMGNDLYNAPYPIEFKLIDGIIVFITVIVVGFIAAYFPSVKAKRQPINMQQL